MRKTLPDTRSIHDRDVLQAAKVLLAVTEFRFCHISSVHKENL